MKHVVTLAFAVVTLWIFVPNAEASHGGKCLVDVEVDCDGDCDPTTLSGVVLKIEALEAYGGGGGACPKLEQAVTIKPKRPVLTKDGERLRFERTNWGSFEGDSVSWKYVGPTPGSVGGCTTAPGHGVSWVWASLLIAACVRRRRAGP